MEKRRDNIKKIYLIIGLILIITFPAIFIYYNSYQEKLQDYQKAGGEIVVVFHKAVSEGYLQELVSSFDSKVSVVRHIGDYALLSVDNSRSYQAVLKNLQKQPLVAAAQTNGTVASMDTGSDTHSYTQWAIDNPGRYSFLSESGIETTAKEGVDMDVEEAWELLDKESLNKREVVVAVIDTGVDYTHPDLADRMWVNKNEIPDDGIDNDKNGYIDDIYGWDFYNGDSSVCHYKYYSEYDKNLALPEDNDDHGTHVAGIIGAAADTEFGVEGVASDIDVKIMVLKINGGPKGTGNVSNAIEAVKYATMMGADICNMSWGTTQYTEALKQVISESDMLFVAAAGNTGTNNDKSPIYPANYRLDNLLSVTFIDPAGELTSLSNYGKNSIDIAAPGDYIYSTVVGNFGTMSGSSMAAPQVSAVAAMLYATSEHLYPANVRNIILNSIKPLDNLAGYIINPGIPSAYTALKDSGNLIQDTDSPGMSFETIYNKGDMRIPVNVLDKGGSGIRILKWIFGEKTLEDFKRGTAGASVTDDKLDVSKAGTYTFYAADYAGNETVKSYEVKEDILAPRIAAYYTIDNSYKKRTVTTKISDSQSGIKKVKYMFGLKTEKDFLPAGKGTELKLKDGKISFQVMADGIYTIYAMDNRGNTSLKLLLVKTIKATDIKFIRNKVTLKKGDQYTVRAFIKPINSTDVITFSSSDKSIATVNNAGVVKALKEGNVYIIAKTSSGVKAVCEIIISKK